VPALVHYSLTPHGHSVLPVAEQIRRWGMAHQAAHSNAHPENGEPDARALCDVALPEQVGGRP
jgi:DNA-binding HxlR family transcriptional regulator